MKEKGLEKLKKEELQEYFCLGIKFRQDLLKVNYLFESESLYATTEKERSENEKSFLSRREEILKIFLKEMQQTQEEYAKKILQEYAKIQKAEE